MKPVLAALACIVAVSWIYLLSGAGMPTMDMGGGKVMLMPPPSWTLGYATITFAMWSIMMVAMMIPSAAPVIVRVANGAQGFSTAALFTLGYLIVWTIFSAVATTAQWAFDAAHVLSDSHGSSQRSSSRSDCDRGRPLPVVATETRLLATLLLVEKFVADVQPRSRQRA